ncbi:uncharacterized protein L199_001204 [Kwoniella botswanensis]|uniref:uncharacterized protein n=1 Tax=Kwoniella botswanensis TaxID=1268659 RepID=UPI00315DC588
MTVINGEYIPVASGGRSIQYVGSSVTNGAIPYTKRDGTIPRRWILNALTSNTPGMVITGAWRRPGDRAAEYNTIKYRTDLTQLLEKGKFSAVFSPAGVAFGSKHGEALFTNMPNIEKAKLKVEEYRTAPYNRGRDPYGVKVVLGVTVYVGETDEAAQAKLDDFKQYSSKLGAEVLFSNRVDQDLSVYPEDADLREVGTAPIKGILRNLQSTHSEHNDWTRAGLADLLGVRGLRYPPIVGSPTTVADHLQRIITEADVDDFNIA